MTPLTRVAAAAGIALLTGCSGGGDSDNAGHATGPSTPTITAEGSYLHVGPADFYYGTQPVGGELTQEIEIQNRGADRYPLEAMVLTGTDADDFTMPIYGDVTLEPAQAIRIPVTFAPLDDGRKLASLDIDYRTIVQAPPEASELEQAYYEASELARRGELASSRVRYEQYLESEPATVNKRRAAMRVPIVQEARNYGDGEDSRLYLEALESRDKANPTMALLALDALVLADQDSFLADDAQYLKGYIALMDLDDPALALREFQTLVQRYPDSTYYDTALYGEAIAQERLGNDRLAIELYERLLARHTGVEALGVRLPRDDLVARLWFGRADAALKALGVG